MHYLRNTSFLGHLTKTYVTRMFKKIDCGDPNNSGQFCQLRPLKQPSRKKFPCKKNLKSRKNVDLSPRRFEFLKKYSTIDGLLLPTETISMGRDNNNIVTASFISFSKALDSTSSDLFCKYLWPPTLIIIQFYYPAKSLRVSVCLLAGFLINNWSDFDEIW